MKTFTETVKEFNSLVQQYKFIEAVDKFYDQDIISTDNSNEPTKGMENFRKAVKILFPIQKLKNSNYFRQLLKKTYLLLIGIIFLLIKCLVDLITNKYRFSVGGMVKSFRKIIFTT